MTETRVPAAAESATEKDPPDIKPLETINRHQFRRAQARLFHRQMRYELLMNMGVVAAVCMVFWNSTPRLYIGGWSLLIMLTLAWRSLYITDRSATPNKNEVSVWREGYGFAALISGTAWGFVGA